jgi:hypothetical protein
VRKATRKAARQQARHTDERHERARRGARARGEGQSGETGTRAQQEQCRAASGPDPVEQAAAGDRAQHLGQHEGHHHEPTEPVGPGGGRGEHGEGERGHRLAKGTVSEHLTALRAAGLLDATRCGRAVHYRRTELGDRLVRS